MQEWQTKCFVEAVKAQAFGSDVKKFVSFEAEIRDGVDQFASDVTFGDVIVEKHNGEVYKEGVVIKTLPFNDVAEIVLDADAQFHNEVLFFSKVVPLLRKHDTNNVLLNNFPEFIYGKATAGLNRAEDIIIFKNLHKKGFKLTDEKVFLNKEHIDLALDRIAKFHALSLKCQWNEPAAFQEVVAQIMSIYKENPGSERFTKGFLKCTTFRGIDALREDPEYKDKLADISAHCEKADYWMKKYQGPSDSLSVITHGDFCRNNMMFRYDRNGVPEEVVFFDLATIKFCSPVIDTSFLTLFNTSPAMRRLHCDDFLRTYYDSLSGQLHGYPLPTSFKSTQLNRNKLPGVNLTLDTVGHEWRSKGIYGYYVASFFQPMMLVPSIKEDLQEAAKEESPGKRVKVWTQFGGPKATKYLAEIVKHMIDNKYIFEH